MVAAVLASYISAISVCTVIEIKLWWWIEGEEKG